MTNENEIKKPFVIRVEDVEVIKGGKGGARKVVQEYRTTGVQHLPELGLIRIDVSEAYARFIPLSRVLTIDVPGELAGGGDAPRPLIHIPR